jgi:hypothetical protein
MDIEDVNLDVYVGKMKSELDNIWKEFTAYTQKHPDICRKGRMNGKRLPSSTGKDEELRRKAKIDAFIESLKVKNITDILWTVHEMSGFLDCFKLVSYHGNSRSEEERTKRALITVLARGMNIGLKGIAKSIQEKDSIWRLINADHRER